MHKKSLRVGIVVGEASGDTLGAGLIQALQTIHPDIQFEGIGGPKMKQLGCQSLFDMEELAVMGIAEVLPKLRRLLSIRKQLVQHFTDNPPDVFIGIDAPDFNLGLEKRLKQQGIKTVHYVCPSIWAWREKRVFTVAEATHLVLCLLPFEKAFLDKYQVPGRFVGHTLADSVPVESDKSAAREALALLDSERVLAVLPGSRGGEVARLLPDFLSTVIELQKTLPNLKVCIPAANLKRRQQIEQIVNKFPLAKNIRVLDGQAREVMTAADSVLLASGTASFEAMLCKKPMVVCYKLNWLTFQIAKRAVKAKFFSLPNLLANQELVPELVQDQVQPHEIAKRLLPMIQSPDARLVERFTELHKQLKKDADIQSAQAVMELIQ